MSEPSQTTKTRSRRPSVEKTAQTRSRIVGAALDTFLERGFATTRMSDVAHRAGLAKGTLYLYFADKDALFAGVLQEVMVETLAGLREMTREPGEPVRAFISRVVRPLVRDMESSRRGALVRLVMAESTRFPEVAQMYRSLVIDPGMDTIRHIATLAVESGETRAQALVRFPQLLIAPLVLGALWNGNFGPQDPLDLEAMFEAHLDTIFGA